MPVALVTGANRGIGLEVCRQLAARGYRVLLAARDFQKGDIAAHTVAGNVQALELDVTNAQSVERAKNEAIQKAGRVDVLVNNAGVLIGENEDLFATSIDTFRKTLETNLIGAIAVSQAFVPAMITRRFGRVVNVCSRAGQLSTMSDYAA